MIEMCLGVLRHRLRESALAATAAFSLLGFAPTPAQAQADRYISFSSWDRAAIATNFIALENYAVHAANPTKKAYPYGAWCIFGADQSVFIDVYKKNWTAPGKLVFPERNFTDLNQASFSAFSEQIARWDCGKIFVPLAWLNKAVSMAEANRGTSQAAYDLLAALPKARVSEVMVSVAQVTEEAAVRERLRARVLAEAAVKEAEERKEAEIRRLAEQDRLRKEADARQQAAQKEKQARDEFIGGYRGKGAYWFLFAKVAVPLNKLCVVGEDTAEALNAYASREIAAKAVKTEGGPDFSNLIDVSFVVTKRASFDEVISSMGAKSHEDRCDFAVAPFDNALSLLSARPNDFGAILARPFVFSRADVEETEKEVQAEAARKLEEKRRTADAEAARQAAQRLRDEAEKKKAAVEYEARKEARRKQDLEEQRVAALNAELDRIKQQEAKELAEREAVKRAEQEKRDQERREREAKARAEREAAQRAETARQEKIREQEARAAEERRQSLGIGLTSTNWPARQGVWTVGTHQKDCQSLESRGAMIASGENVYYCLKGPDRSCSTMGMNFTKVEESDYEVDSAAGKIIYRVYPGNEIVEIVAVSSNIPSMRNSIGRKHFYCGSAPSRIQVED